MTMFEKIKAMSVEELATLIFNSRLDGSRVILNSFPMTPDARETTLNLLENTRDEIQQIIIEELESEVEEDDI